MSKPTLSQMRAVVAQMKPAADEPSNAREAFVGFLGSVVPAIKLFGNDVAIVRQYKEAERLALINPVQDEKKQNVRARAS